MVVVQENLEILFLKKKGTPKNDSPIKTKNMKYILKIVWVVFIVGSSNVHVFGCTCDGDTTYKVGVLGSSVIIEGVVLDITLKEVSDIGDVKLYEKEVTILVSQYLKKKKFHWKRIVKNLRESEHIHPSMKRSIVRKNKLDGVIVVSTGVAEDDCGFPFVLGDKYLVFMNWVVHTYSENMNVKLTTSLCTKTIVYSEFRRKQIQRILSKNKG